jgi:hypothetical protein
MANQSISLAELLTAVVDDLWEAERTRLEKDRAARVALERVELELKATTSKEGRGGLKFQIIGADFGGKREAVSTIKVVLVTSASLTGDSAEFLFSEPPRASPRDELADALQLEHVRKELQDIVASAVAAGVAEDPALGQVISRLTSLHEQLGEESAGAEPA